MKPLFLWDLTLQGKTVTKWNKRERYVPYIYSPGWPFLHSLAKLMLGLLGGRKEKCLNSVWISRVPEYRR